MSILSRVASFHSQIADAVELALIKAASNGDSRAFAKLVSKYERRLRFFGMRFFKNDTDCDDFIQEVFIKVFTGLNSFKGDSQFSTWLMRILWNYYSWFICSQVATTYGDCFNNYIVMGS